MLHDYLLLAALATRMIPGVFAQVNQTDECSNGETLQIPIHDQTDLDDLVQKGCTTIWGQLHIQSDYNGSFILNNVTNITSGGITTQEEADGVPGVTSIELPDLVTIGGSVNLTRMDNLELLSMPKLKSIPGTLSGIFPQLATSLNFSDLQNVTNIDLVGNFTRLGLESLQHVTETLSICNAENCNSNTSTPQSSMDISLPSLWSASVFYVDGRVSSLHAPNLTSINGSSSDVPRGLNLSLSGPIELSFPKLATVEPIAVIDGDIESLDLPKLTQYPDTFSLHTNRPMDVDLSPVDAHNLIFTGAIRRINITSLMSTFNLTVDPAISLYCTSIYVTGSPSEMPYVTCDSGTYYTPPYYNSPGLSTPIKVGIAVAVIVGVAVVGVMGCFFYRRRQLKKQTKVGLVWRPNHVDGSVDWEGKKDVQPTYTRIA
ncbi:hypothetical protein BJX99DRAFT_228716 [Aspergillus californicus]